MKKTPTASSPVSPPLDFSVAQAHEYQVDRRINLSYEEFEARYLLPRIPVILADATSKWKASEWTPQWFKERYPAKVVKTDQGSMTMDSFIDAITEVTDRPGPFLREQPLKDVFPDLVDHVLPMPAYVLPNWLGANYLIGAINRRLNAESHIQVNFCGRRVFPYLHIDTLGVHAFITQHFGSKEFVVFSPEQEPFLYRKGENRFSEITDVDTPDLARFPLFANARPLRLTLHPGESIFVPCGWWHTTKVTGASLSTVLQISNASNWPDLIAFLERYSSHKAFAPLFSLWLRTFGFFKRRADRR